MEMSQFKKIRVVSSFFNQLHRNLMFLLRFARPKEEQPRITTSLHDAARIDASRDLILNIEKCIQDSQVGPLMPLPIRLLEGMSGQRFRSLLNKLIKIPISGSYLEIGTFKGSTAISALYQNQRTAILIDNWSEFGGPKETALKNLMRHCPTAVLNIVDQSFDDFCKVNTREKIAVYFYDGGHSFEEQMMAVKFIDKLNFDKLIFIVDDFRWETVQKATSDSIGSLSSSLVQSWIILPSEKDRLFRYGHWHNGYFIGLLSKI